MNWNLTPDDLFGRNGIVPLNAFAGVGDAVCPYCEKIVRGINFPPPTIIIIHSCPVCNNLVIPWLGHLVAVNKDKLNNDKEARKHITECLFNTMTPMLMTFADRFVSGEASLKTFLDSCWNIVYELVGEKEDSRTFLNKLKQRAIENRDQHLGKEYEQYWEKMSQIFERVIASKTRVIHSRPHGKWSPEEMSKYSETISSIKGVDDFLQKFGDSVK